MTAAAPITPEILLHGYCLGVFPMAARRDSAELRWFDPPERGILPLDSFHLPRRLRRTVLSDGNCSPHSCDRPGG